MEVIGQAIPLQKLLEDPLAQLPCSTIITYPAGGTIYSHDQPSTSIYLVIDGKVKVCRPCESGFQVIVDIYQTDEFFGEAALLGLPQRGEISVAIGKTTVMAWTAAEIEEIVMRRPKLGIALLQFVVQRSANFVDRIESFAVDNIAHRLARALIGFSERFGEQADNGSVRIIPLTHELLSQYVGTSREIVTHYMNQFRRDGYLQYSRQRILVRTDEFRDWLRQDTSVVKADSAVA
jgi:CRP/FNR family cyclic AMP-dependent transcriptional regulator